MWGMKLKRSFFWAYGRRFCFERSEKEGAVRISQIREWFTENT